MASIIISGETAKNFLSKKHEVLTLAKAKSLVGKRIRWTHPVYAGNHQAVYESTIGEIISRYDAAKREPMEGYASKAEYWDAECEKFAKEARNTLVILDEGGDTYMRCEDCGMFDEPTFTCSDADRAVEFEAI